MDAKNNLQEFIISRVFDAPRELVWKIFTNADHLKQWWGPKGFKVHTAKLDFRPGGSFHYGMEAPDGSPMWGMFRYREITPPSRIVLINSFSDEAGGITRHPMAPDWPLELLSVFSFEEEGGKTRFTVTWSPLNATEQERAVFAANHASMNQGWGGTLEQMQAYLAKAA